MTIKVQIDDIVRDATPEEIADLQRMATTEAAAAAAADAKAAALASARTKLAALGLTNDEIKALVG